MHQGERGQRSSRLGKDEAVMTTQEVGEDGKRTFSYVQLLRVWQSLPSSFLTSVCLPEPCPLYSLPSRPDTELSFVPLQPSAEGAELTLPLLQLGAPRTSLGEKPGASSGFLWETTCPTTRLVAPDPFVQTSAPVTLLRASRGCTALGAAAFTDRKPHSRTKAARC